MALPLPLPRFFFLSPALALFFSCARSEIRDSREAMRPVEKVEVLNDDLGLDSFRDGLQKHIEYTRKSRKGGDVLRFGNRSITRAKYLEALQDLLTFALKTQNWNELQAFIQNRFDLLEVYGNKDWGDIFLTSYYKPVLPGSLKKQGNFTQALYKRPSDHVLIDAAAFENHYEPVDNPKKKARASTRWITAQIKNFGNEKIPDYRVVPYPARNTIEDEKTLQDKNLELVWIDPIDAFFLQIQGSGLIQLKEGGELLVGYAAQNGQPYVPIGKYLFDKIPSGQVTAQSIQDYLRSLEPEEMQALLNQNPSYVFFQKVDRRAPTSYGIEAIAGRTIATDLRYFPKGALAYLEFPKPLFKGNSSRPNGFEQVGRFVFDHDTGGAIKGPGRADLFYGEGNDAGRSAGVIKHTARLLYLFPRDPALLAR